MPYPSEGPPSERPQSLISPQSLVSVELPPDHPEILAGLEALLNLGLISDRQTRSIAAALACKCPTPVSQPASPSPESQAVAPARAAAPPQGLTPRQRLIPRQTLVTGLLSEISILWLLGLGVFLVIGSSAVIAAIQWRNFTAVGQYLILLAYTLAFAGAAVWTGRQPQLQTTSAMLQITTLLLIPLNVWMMDSFRLLATPVGCVSAIAASGGLIALNLHLLRAKSRLTQIHSLLLAGLHWGWGLPALPLALTYLGVFSTTALQFGSAARQAPSASQAPVAVRSPLAWPVLLSSLLLLVRALLAAHAPLHQFGLALALVGGQLVWFNRQRARPFLSPLGTGLGGLGLLVSAAAPQWLGLDPLWQSLLVSVLGLILLGDRFRCHREPWALVGLWGLGLQSYWLLQVMVPAPLRRAVVTGLMDWANLSQGGWPQGAWPLLGLAWFPYGLATVVWAQTLMRRASPHNESHNVSHNEPHNVSHNEPHNVSHNEPHNVSHIVRLNVLVLGLGALGAACALVNPGVRALYFTLATGLLGVNWAMVRSRLNAWKPWQAYGVVGLTHTAAIAALLSWILWRWPNLGAVGWIWVLLVSAWGQWLWTGLGRDRFWQRTAWYLGLAQAALSYPVLIESVQQAPGRGLLWLGVPLALGLLGRRDRLPMQATARWLSLGALLLGLGLVLGNADPWVGYTAIAAVLMALSAPAGTSRLWLETNAAATVGFAVLSFVVWGRFHGPVSLGGLDLRFGIVAFACLSLSLVRWGMVHWGTPRGDAYRLSLDGWGLGLGGLNLATWTVATSWSGWAGQRWMGLDVMDYDALLLSDGILVLAAGLRLLQAPVAWSGWGIAWGAALLVWHGVAWTGGGLASLVTVLLSLALASWLGSEWCWRRRGGFGPLASLGHGLPLFYGAVALAFAHSQWSPWVGWATLAAACAAIAVGRRSPNLKPFTGLGLAGVVLGAYEWLISWLQQQPASGTWGDGMALLALLAVGFVGLTLSLRPWLRNLLRLEDLDLDRFAGANGALALGLGLLAWGMPLSPLGQTFWCSGGLWLGLSLLIQGRRRAESWVYGGWSLSVAALVQFWVWRGQQQWLGHWLAVVATAIAVGLWFMPWQQFGWRRQPWQRIAQVMPGLAAVLTLSTIAIPGLLLVAGFYLAMALASGSFGFSYMGLAVALWGLGRWLWDSQVSDPLGYALLLSLAVAYASHLDPNLQGGDRRELRHWLRLGAAGLVALTDFYGTTTWGRGLVTAGLGLGFGGVGLALRTRAYLYVGTLMFLGAVVRQLWLFVREEALVLWGLGILVGVALIWIAATFEARRATAIAWVNYWSDALGLWE